jgi:hypothetical protein
MAVAESPTARSATADDIVNRVDLNRLGHELRRKKTSHKKYLVWIVEQQNIK